MIKWKKKSPKLNSLGLKSNSGLYFGFIVLFFLVLGAILSFKTQVDFVQGKCPISCITYPRSWSVSFSSFIESSFLVS